MKLIVGLGNPGEKYQFTRHNLGFVVVDQLLKDLEPIGKTVWENSPKFKSDTARVSCPKSSEKIILVKPKTYMNNSGLAVQLVASYWRLESSDIWVIHDDIDLPLGSIRIRFGGSSAGHRGLESIINSLKTEKFCRFRLGIGRPQNKFKVQSSKFKVGVEEFVLEKFGQGEVGKLKELIKRGSKAIGCALENGLDVAMSRFNTK